MSENPSTLYAKLLGETAAITWQELEPFFARGVLLLVDPAQDLIAVAEAVAQNEHDKVASWLADASLHKTTPEQAQDLLARQPPLWAVVVAPWVLIQERAQRPALH